MSADHATGFLDLLAALPCPVYDGKTPTKPGQEPPARPYVVFYGDLGLAAVDNLAGVSGRVDGTHQTTVVGDEADSVRIIQKAIRAAVLDVKPSVSGRSCFPIRQAYSNPVRRDDDVQPALMFATDGWHVASVSA